MNAFLTAKHWQLWLVGVLIPILLYPYGMYRVVRRIQSLADQFSNVDKDDALNLVYSAFGELSLPVMAALLIGNLVLFGWYVAIDRKLLADLHEPWPNRSSYYAAIVVVFFMALAPVWLAGVYGGEVMNKMHEAERAGTFAAQFSAQTDYRPILINFVWYAYFGLLVFIALQLAKGLKPLFEKHFGHRADVGIIVLQLLFPIVGFWKLQPKLNAIIAEDQGFGRSDQFEP